MSFEIFSIFFSFSCWFWSNFFSEDEGCEIVKLFVRNVKEKKLDEIISFWCVKYFKSQFLYYFFIISLNWWEVLLTSLTWLESQVMFVKYINKHLNKYPFLHLFAWFSILEYYANSWPFIRGSILIAAWSSSTLQSDNKN